jgi:hypothetical protein
MENKRGDTNWVLIMLILGILVLVVLAGGFLLGWNKFLPWVSTNNIDTVLTQCQVACTTNNQYSWCTQTRNVNDGTADIYSNVTCNYLTTTELGIPSCPQISCSP